MKSNDTGKKTLKKFGDAYRVLRKPLITEKVTNLGVQNKYCFEVAKDANKIQIAEAINEVYRIKPTSVNTVKVSGKNVRHGKTKGKQKDWKKAIVTLPAGSQFNI
ncbi:MAG: 50S ribosomal protein L23 [Patescibacteria group bacterium]